MRHSLTFRAADYEALVSHLFENNQQEHGAYLLCGVSQSRDEARLLVREVLPIDAAEVLSASQLHMKISSKSFMRAMKRADKTNQAFVFVHSHPRGLPRFSQQDDAEESKLFRTAFTRIQSTQIHASLVLAARDALSGRVWLRDGTCSDMDIIRVLGPTFQFFSKAGRVADVSPFDRQIAAFGGGIQSLFASLRIGIVGLGGTGSSVAEQLIRLGVGHLILFDGDDLERSNVSRVYGSSIQDVGKKKVRIAEASAKRIGLGTQIIAVEQPITFRSAAEILRDCDVVFGCTDDEWGRSILNRLATYYYIPIFDMGVKLDSSNGHIRSVQGRVTTLMPGAACLFCRGRVTGERIAAESLFATNPEKADKLQREGYIPELNAVEPAVISFTTAIAATAVTELLQRLTGFMGPNRQTTEVIQIFDQTKLRPNRVTPDDACMCADSQKLGSGDREPFLDLIWRSEQRASNA